MDCAKKKKFKKCSSNGCEKWNCCEKGVTSPNHINGNWVNFQICNGGEKETCHDCSKECAHCGKLTR